MGQLDLNTKKSFSAIFEFSILRGGKGRKPWIFRGADVKKHIFEHNSAHIYLTKTKLHIGRLDLNTKKSFSAIFEFSILRGGGKGGKR